MVWRKASDAARDWCGGISPKLLYASVKRGDLKAAHIGSGRNLLFCEEHCTEWLLATVKQLRPTHLLAARDDLREARQRG